jgi:thiazole synthase ThiGH ThiG subunit
MKLNLYENIIRSHLIACTAYLHHGNESACLDLKTSIKVIETSKSGAIIYHCNSGIISSECISKYSWSFIDLLENLENISQYTILANTSRCRNKTEAVNMAKCGIEGFSLFSHKIYHQSNPIIKLEIFDDKLISNNHEVLRAIEKINNLGVEIIPLILPIQKHVEECYNLGIKMIRIQSGEIGKFTGIKNIDRITEIIKNSPIPIILECGIRGTIDVKRALKIGASAVLINSAIHKSNDPVKFASQIRKNISNFNS